MLSQNQSKVNIFITYQFLIVMYKTLLSMLKLPLVSETIHFPFNKKRS